MDVPARTVRSDEGAGGVQQTPGLLALLATETQRAGPALLPLTPAGPRHHRGRGLLVSWRRSVQTVNNFTVVRPILTLNDVVFRTLLVNKMELCSQNKI